MIVPKNKSTILLRLFLLLIMAGIAALILRGASRKAAVPEPVAEKATPVTIAPVQPVSLDNRIILPGKLDASQDLMIPIEKPGTLTEVPVDKGATVTQGQLLCKIDDRIWEDALRQAEIDSREADKEWKRWQEIHKSGAVSVSDYDAYKTRADTAQIALNNARINLEKCSVTSPANGYVNKRLADSGEYVKEGQEIFQILQLDHMKLVLDIPEQNVMALKLQDEIPFTVKAIPNCVFTGRVSFIAAKASDGSNSFIVEALVDNPNLLLKAGMIADVQLHVGQLEEAIAIPLAAVIPDKGEYVVFIRRNGCAERCIVRIAEIRGSQVIIESGIQPGDELIVEGHRVLSDGMPVEVLQKTEN